MVSLIEKVQRIIMIVLAIIIVSLLVLLAISDSRLKSAQLEVARLKGVNQAKTEQLQEIADNSGAEFEKIEEKQNDTTKIIERRFETIVEKNPTILNTECIDADTFGLLKELYASRDAEQPETTMLGSDTSGGEDRKGSKSSVD